MDVLNLVFLVLGHLRMHRLGVYSILYMEWLKNVGPHIKIFFHYQEKLVLWISDSILFLALILD
jgi:hypothetical protein